MRLSRIALTSLMSVLAFASCKDIVEHEPTVFSCNGYVENGIPSYSTYEDFERDGIILSNAAPQERRQSEVFFYSLQSLLEDIQAKTDDYMTLPQTYPDYFEFVGADSVRQITPATYACLIDTAGLFRVDSRLHKMKGHVYASGQGATPESLDMVLRGEEPSVGCDYQVVDILEK